MEECQQKDACATREKLIAAAGEVFAEKGYRGALIREITCRAGANVAAVNYHFHDKFELYMVVLNRAHKPVIDAMAPPLTADTAEGRIRELLTKLLRSALDPSRPPWQSRVIGRELMEPSPALDLMHQQMEPTSQRLADAIGEIRPDFSPQQIALAASGVVARCIFHVYHGHLLPRIFPNIAQPELDVLVEHVIEYSLAALGGMPHPDGLTSA